MKNFFLYSFILSLSFSIQAQNKSTVEQYKLDNGLTVFLCEDHQQQKIFGTVVCLAGSKDDPSDATGMAHYMEHMLFKGTTELGTSNWQTEKIYIDSIFYFYDQLGKTKDDVKRKEIQKNINNQSVKAQEFAIPNEFPNLVKSIGGTDMNATTGQDITLFYNAFPPGQIEKWLDLYSHRFIQPVFRSFQAELEVVYEEKNKNIDNFSTLLFESFLYNFYKKHPYGQHSIIGTVDDLKNPSLTKMQEFYNTYYVANNLGLVLVGDFKSEDIKPMIASKFGRIPFKEIPSRPIFIEEPFHKREFVEGNYSPVKLALLGYRIAPEGSEDAIATDIFMSMLSNTNQTGSLDQLINNNKILQAQVLPKYNKDYSSTIIIAIPKILGQSLEEAEKLITDELSKIRKGEIDSTLFETIKLEKYREFQLKFESQEDKALTIAKAFGKGQNIEDALNYPQKIKGVKIKDVISIANKYFNENYLAFYSQIGFPEKEKISKPDYMPLVNNSSNKSGYAHHFDSIPDIKIDPYFIDFEKDIQTSEVKSGVTIYTVQNPINDIFSLTFRYCVGNYQLPLLKYSSQILNYAGVDSLNLARYKKEFAKIGCSFNISSDKSYFKIELEGMENQLVQAISLTNRIIKNPVIDFEKLKIILQGEEATRELENSEPEIAADALFEYVKYGKESEYINRLTIRQIEDLKIENLIQVFKKAITYPLEIHYTGNSQIADFTKIVSNNFTFSDSISSSISPVIQPINIIDKNSVFLLNKNNALQSKIYILTNGQNFNNKQEPLIDGFNLYFGGDFSGLVLQQIREYRSLAYSANAEYIIPLKSDFPCTFTGFIGTQADKTSTALQTFIELLNDMPQKPERISMIKSYLQGAVITSQPLFRKRSFKVVEWKLKGYSHDPAIDLIPAYNNLSFNDLNNFYSTQLKGKPYAIAIMADKQRLNIKEISKFGVFNEIKQKDLFKN